MVATNPSLLLDMTQVELYLLNTCSVHMIMSIASFAALQPRAWVNESELLSMHNTHVVWRRKHFIVHSLQMGSFATSTYFNSSIEEFNKKVSRCN